MDAGRYRKHFQKMLSRATNGAPPAKDREYVQALWQRLVDAYIRPNGSREVNLPSDVRDPILLLTGGALPPAPQSLDEAVQKTYELMEDAYPQTALPVVSSYPEGRSTYEDRSSFQRRKRHTRSSPPPQSAVEPHAHSYTAPAFVNRKSAPSTLTTSLNKSRFSVKLSPTTSSPAGSAAQSNIDAVSDLNLTASGSNSAGQGLTDDTGSTDSPANESPMTPPTSPPMSDVSPKRDSGMWGLKKLGRLSGMKVGKKKSSGGIRSEEQ
ncbi:hypothetical protein LTR86_001245 [Recurvomyces mirabilis]|nr:hypothetical protein LTR86_001245 [Recurvomyces mirabilis]